MSLDAIGITSLYYHLLYGNIANEFFFLRESKMTCRVHTNLFRVFFLSYSIQFHFYAMRCVIIVKGKEYKYIFINNITSRGNVNVTTFCLKEKRS